MKIALFLLVLILVISCQVTETIHFNPDGSGTIELSNLRDENSYMQLAKENYTAEDVYKDTTYFFADYIKENQETFSRTAIQDQNVFLRYSEVKVHKKKSSYEKEFRSTYTQNFKKGLDIVDLYKTEEYIDDIQNNYALSAEEHYYKVSYNFEGNHFYRNIQITDPIELQKQFDKIEELKTRYKGYKLVQCYMLNYHFPRKIKTISNPMAKISDDGKSLSIQYQLIDCLQNPVSTNLEVVLESEAID